MTQPCNEVIYFANPIRGCSSCLLTFNLPPIRSVFCAENVRVALDYFKSRGHGEITIIMHGIRLSACNARFTKEEIDRYFIFTSVRWLDNQAPMIADDDR